MEDFSQKTSVMAYQRSLQRRAGPASVWFLSKEPQTGLSECQVLGTCTVHVFLLNLTSAQECLACFTKKWRRKGNSLECLQQPSNAADFFFAPKQRGCRGPRLTFRWLLHPG